MIRPLNQLPQQFDRVQFWSFVAAAAGWIACIIGWIFSPRDCFTAYLYSYLFFLGISLGSLSMVMLHHMTGGNWGRPIRGIMETAMMLMPLLLLLFIPILVGLRNIYPWAVPELVRADPTLQHRSVYFSMWFFTLRAVGFLVFWNLLALFLSWASLRYQRTQSRALASSMRKISGPALLLHAIIMSFASVDWVMSRQAHWFSTIFGFIFLCGQALAALAFAIVILRAIVVVAPLPAYINSSILIDLGNLLMTLVILWAYMSFAQLLVIWSGNVRQEVSFYIQRGTGHYNSWRIIGLVLITFHFFVPFALLLFRYAKRHFNILTSIAALLLVMRVVDLYWNAAPSTLEADRVGFFVTWLTPFGFLAIGGLWLGGYIWLLRRRPLISRLEGEPEPIIGHGETTAPGIG